MATAIFAGASFADNAVFINGVYDTTTLRMVSVDWQNLTSRPGSMMVNGPASFHQTFALIPNTVETSVDVSAIVIQMVQTTFTNPKTGGQQTVVSLPAGWSISFNWG